MRKKYFLSYKGSCLYPVSRPKEMTNSLREASKACADTKNNNGTEAKALKITRKIAKLALKFATESRDRVKERENPRIREMQGINTTPKIEKPKSKVRITEPESSKKSDRNFADENSNFEKPAR